MKFVEIANDVATFGVTPNIIFIIDVPAEKGLARVISKTRMEAKGLEFHQKVREGYLKIAEQDQDKYIIIPYVENDIDGMQEQMRVALKSRFRI